MIFELYKYCSSSVINDNIILIDIKKLPVVSAAQFQNLFNHFKKETVNHGDSDHLTT